MCALASYAIAGRPGRCTYSIPSVLTTHAQEVAALRIDGALPRHVWGGGLSRAELAFVDGEVRRHLVSPLALCVSAIPTRC